MYNNREIINFLSESGLVSRDILRDARSDAERMGRDVATLLVQRGALSYDELRKIQSRLYGIKFVDLSQKKIPYDMLVRIPEPVARKHNTIMFDADDDVVHIALLDLDAVPVLRNIYSGPEKQILYFTNEDAMRKTLKQYQRELTNRYGETIRREAGLIAHTAHDESFVSEKAVDHISVIKIVDTLLSHAMLANASYIHIESLFGDVTVRYRLGGKLYDAMVLPHYVHAPLLARIKMLAGADPKITHAVQYGSFAMTTDADLPVQTGETQFHVAIQPTLNGEKAVIRVLGERSAGFMLESLGFSPRGLDLVHHALKQKNGLILVTGPENSGKSTCLYTMLDSLISPQRSVGTIENPIEYDVRGVTQMKVSERTGVTFASGIKTLAQNDTDVIMVGDLDKAETMQAALHAGALKALVLGGFTSRGAGHALSAVATMADNPSLVASTIDLVVSSRLIKTIGKDKTQYFLSDAEVKKIEKVIDVTNFLQTLKDEGVIPDNIKSVQDIPFYKEGREGYVGQTGVYEVMPMTRTVQDLVLKGGKARAIDEEARKSGMLSFFEEGLRKAVLGTTTLEEVFKIHE